MYIHIYIYLQHVFGLNFGQTFEIGILWIFFNISNSSNNLQYKPLNKNVFRIIKKKNLFNQLCHKKVYMS